MFEYLGGIFTLIILIILRRKQSNCILCWSKAVCSVTHILPIILSIPWRDDDTVIHQLDVITSWNLAIFRPRVVKRDITWCLTWEKTRSLLFTNYLRRGKLFHNSGWHCVERVKIVLRLEEILTKSCSCKTGKGITNIWGHYHDVRLVCTLSSRLPCCYR